MNEESATTRVNHADPLNEERKGGKEEEGTKEDASYFIPSLIRIVSRRSHIAINNKSAVST